jgi:hypothetical protein
MALSCRFERDDRGFPVVLVNGHPGLTEVLEDSVGARRPRGIGGPLVSTFLVDWILHKIDANRGQTGSVVLSSGNATHLVLETDRVRAESLYELFETEEVSAVDVSELLTRYRAEIVRVAGSDEPQPFLKPPDEVWTAGDEVEVPRAGLD